jgi:repressor of nif and glnA expression
MKTEDVALARLRSDLLDTLYLKYPQALSLDQLEADVRVACLTRGENSSPRPSAIREQLAVLDNAGLVRSSTKGYMLTEKGRRDRQQAARFLVSTTNNQPTPPPEAA